MNKLECFSLAKRLCPGLEFVTRARLELITGAPPHRWNPGHTCKYKARLKQVGRDEHSSLFVRSVSDEKKVLKHPNLLTEAYKKIRAQKPVLKFEKKNSRIFIKLYFLHSLIYKTFYVIIYVQN
jgi:hypothetical protein